MDLSIQQQLEEITGSDILKKVHIPKRIFQTWKTHTVPNHWKPGQDSIKEMMPDWEHVLFDDEDNRNFIKEHFPDYLKYYDAFPYNIQRADVIRYAYLYVFGGLFFDSDFRVLKPLDELFTETDADVYLVHSGNVGGCVTNSFMASKPGCKFWLDVLEETKRVLPWYYLGKHIVTMCSTGPIMLSNVCNKTKMVIAKLPGRLLMPCSVCNINCNTEGALLSPLPGGGSWNSFDSTFYNFWLCNWRDVVFVLFLLLLVYGIKKASDRYLSN